MHWYKSEQVRKYLGIKNGKLNITRAIFVGISQALTLILPLFLFTIFNRFTINTNGSLVITIIPTVINMLMIPLFKIISLYQKVDFNLVKEKKQSIKFLNEKQAIYTESLLMFASSVLIMLWYIFIGYSYFPKTYEHFFILTIIFSILFVVVFTSIILITLFKKYIKKGIKRLKKMKSNAEK
ncbi:hypothetical protein [Staphylococcus gallinarum]|uniref:hypothetical protein n=1 Tax=Staphylococcus gallinarum TaxID=1293 RepID=UPI002DBBA769|nr:hypothetical protein [Staphylococcus gallinarum]MEB7040082.1 hypothetical protein [Staphylococcus gallinarum]